MTAAPLEGGESCCARFSAFHEAPEAFFEDYPPVDEDAISRSRDGERRVTATLRGLFLTRHLAVQHDREDAYDVDAGRYGTPRWDHDTAIGGLALGSERLLRLDGARVLDVASGLSIVGTELSQLGALVDCIDVEMDDDHPSFAALRPAVAKRYGEQLALLRCLSRHAQHPRYTMSTGQGELLDALIARATTIAENYPKVSGTRHLGDATTLEPLSNQLYDLIVCGWLLVHLEPEQERATLASMLRVARPGASIHVRAGYGGDIVDRIGAWFPSVAIVEAAGDRVVLRAS